MKKVCFVLGTRPEIIKLSPVIRECERKDIPFFIIHTNQHYSSEMDGSFFQELHLPKPTYNLDIHETLHGRMVGRMLESIERVLLKENPSLVFVQGDTNTVLAGGLASAKLQIPVGHVEAGLRSYDRTMPEEINRVLVDHVSDYLFCPTQKQADIALGEGIEKKKIYVTGNTVVDAVQQNIQRAEQDMRYSHYKKEKYMLLTMHRPSNVDNPDTLRQIVEALYTVSRDQEKKIYFPIHPRTIQALQRAKIVLDSACIVQMAPFQYLEMLVAQKYAHLILTDSGGVQEEACILKTPCVTIRNTTERPETVEVGANVVAGVTKNGILQAVQKIESVSKDWTNPFGNGDAAEKIIDAVLPHLSSLSHLPR